MFYGQTWQPKQLAQDKPSQSSTTEQLKSNQPTQTDATNILHPSASQAQLSLRQDHASDWLAFQEQSRLSFVSAWK